MVTTNDSPKRKIPLSDNDGVFTLTFIIFGNACETCLVDKYRCGKKYNEKVKNTANKTIIITIRMMADIFVFI